MKRQAGVYRWPKSRLRWWRDPTFPTRAIAAEIGVSHVTVNKARKASKDPTVNQLTVHTGRDGKARQQLTDAVHWLAPFIAAGQLLKPDVVDALLAAAIARGIERADAEAIIGAGFVASGDAQKTTAPAREVRGRSQNLPTP